MKCPAWSSSIAREIPASAEPVGKTLRATYNGVGFAARRTGTTEEGEIWPGYPEAREKWTLT